MQKPKIRMCGCRKVYVDRDAAGKCKKCATKKQGKAA